MIAMLHSPDNHARAGLGAFFRPVDADAAGISYPQLRRLEASGVVERVERGLYWRTDAEITEHHSTAAVCARTPAAVVCLLTALEVHELGTQAPHEVWIAIPHKARPPVARGVRLRITRFSGASLFYGVERTEFEGVPVRITGPARTVVDCFRFWRKFGLDVAVEALDDALESRKATRDQIWRAAEVCGARSLVEPALRLRSC